MNAVTSSPGLKSFLGFPTLPHDISEICNRPSAPPISINAPKSTTLLTTPVTV